MYEKFKKSKRNIDGDGEKKRTQFQEGYSDSKLNTAPL